MTKEYKQFENELGMKKAEKPIHFTHAQSELDLLQLRLLDYCFMMKNYPAFSYKAFLEFWGYKSVRQNKERLQRAIRSERMAIFFTRIDFLPHTDIIKFNLVEIGGFCQLVDLEKMAEIGNANSYKLFQYLDSITNHYLEDVTLERLKNILGYNPLASASTLNKVLEVARRDFEKVGCSLEIVENKKKGSKQIISWNLKLVKEK